MNTGVALEASGSTAYGIPDLVRLAREGSIRVPTFQRSYVWDAADVRSLFDSLYRGFPVGTLLLWRRRGPAGRVALGPLSLDVEERESALWVVDGQQRIVSLVGALSPGFEGVDGRFEVYFDFATRSFVNPRRGVVNPRSMPVRRALETRRLLEWLRRHAEDLESDDLGLADQLGGALRDYKIPAYIVTGDDQSLLRELFDRVNSAGKPMSRAEVFHALFAGDTEPGSAADVVDELKRLRFGTLDQDRVVQSLLAARGGNIQRDLHGEFGADEDPADWYDRTGQALTRSIEFLRAEGVRHLLLVPNTLPIPILAAFFFLHPDPKPWTRRLLSRWMWRGWVHGFGQESGQTPILRRAINSINPRNHERDQVPGEFDAVRSLLDHTPDHPTPELSLHDFSTNRAKSRLVLLTLSSLQPLGPDRTPIDVSGLLEEHGTDAITEFVRGRRRFAAARGFWPADASSIREIEDPGVLRSHAIEEDAAKYLRAGDVERFLTSRENRIRELAFAFLDSRLEPGAILRPPLDDLLVTGLAEED
jgi:hypothetical protein